MSTGADLRRLEHRMTYVRWFGVVFGALSIGTDTGPAPDHATEVAWTLLALLALGSVAIWAALERLDSERTGSRLNHFGFAFDAVVIASFVWLYAYEEPSNTWALLFIIPMEGALRYRLHGAFIGAGVMALLLLPYNWHVAELHGQPFDLNGYIFVTGLGSLIAGIAGTMANNWYEQKVAFEKQSIQLAEADRLKDRFLAVTSHEIRGPLTAVLGALEVVTKRKARLTNEQRDRFLEMGYRQAEHLARLVDDLTITSKIQSHQLGLDARWAELEKIVAEALDAAAAKRRNHQLEVFTEPVACEVDPNRLGQVVRNLVENAYKYTPDRSRVSVTARRSDDGIAITVADTGEGIPASKRDDLFRAFSRIEETSAGKEGVGLGLYVVSQLVAAMGGRIDLTSSLRGTSFHIQIPCATRIAAAAPFELLGQDEQLSG